jgi:hypothetical protein
MINYCVGEKLALKSLFCSGYDDFGEAQSLMSDEGHLATIRLLL